jgi:hypothetical protein
MGKLSPMAIDIRADARLREIAAVMGCPVEWFYASEGEAGDATMTYELLCLWHAIQEPQGRERVLKSARHEAQRETQGTKAAE